MKKLLWALPVAAVVVGATLTVRAADRGADAEGVAAAVLAADLVPAERPYAMGEAAPSASHLAVTHYVRYLQGDRVAYGILEGETIRELSGDYFSDPRPTGRTVARGEVTLLSPLDPMKVQKVLGVAVNFRRPSQQTAVPHPRFFAKMPTALNADDGEVELPPEAGNLNYEGELALVIGRQGRHIPVERALDHVFGVAVGNDYSENTWYGERNGINEPTRLIAKAMDSWAVLGPTIAAGLDFSDLEVVTRLNGEIVNRGRTSDMINSPAMLISYISRYITLMPGDVIYTGTYTPVQGARRVMQPGDVVEVEIESIGVQRSRIVAMKVAAAGE